MIRDRGTSYQRLPDSDAGRSTGVSNSIYADVRSKCDDVMSSKAAEAEQVYLNDLRVYSENGWGLVGLVQAMEAQPDVHPPSEVAHVRARLAASWASADVPLPLSSCAWFEF